MKKLFAVLAFVASVSFMSVYAQDEQPTQDEAVATEQVTEAAAEEAPVVVEEGLHQALKTKFIEGGAGFMSAVVLCLILGLAIAIERIIYLSLATADSKKLLADVEKALDLIEKQLGELKEKTGIEVCLAVILVGSDPARLECYKSILSDPAVYQAAWISASKTVIITLLNLFWTSMLAYTLTRKEYVLRKIITTMLGYFDEMGLYAFSSGINLLLIITILIFNTLVNKLTGASLDEGIGG